ncbi:MAG: phosphate/phosphite/phosphonate ABC transporter substrate-binding protein [Thermodesulfovibrionales bacterium]|nr:phosphate/phosphite/phosphonate ABC transporter substrate-binding protein [Thermodesulfovibrionales bacterium]
MGFTISSLTSIFIFILLINSNCFSEENKRKEILIGLIPEENIFRQMDRYRPLGEYLTSRLNINTRFTILSRYGDIIDRFVTRNLDGAFFGAFTAVLAMEKLGVEPVARPVNLDGTSSAEGYIFVRKDSGINNVKDMRGKTIAFVDRATATGYIFALAYLREHGIENPLDYFKEYYFTGSHDSALLSVLDGRADIGVAKNKIIKERIKKDPLIENEILIIARSSALPDVTLCLSKKLEKGLREKIKYILLTMDRDPEGKKILEKLGALRFVSASKEDFESVYNLLKKANIDIKTYRYR